MLQKYMPTALSLSLPPDAIVLQTRNKSFFLFWKFSLKSAFKLKSVLLATKKMDFSKKIFLFWVMVFYSLCSANPYPYSNGEACIVQYLIAKGKLDEPFQSVQQPSSGCLLVIPLTLQILKSTAKDEITNEFPHEADCLTDEFDQRETFDYLIKMDLIKISSLLSASVRRIRLEQTKEQLNDELKGIANQCLVDDEKFVRFFNENFGPRDETLELYQREYCLAKYVVDNRLLELTNVNLNPHYIDLDRINCDSIIDVERSKTENELSDKLSATEAGRGSMDCVMNAFKSADAFGYKIAFIVLNNVNVTSEVKEVERIKITKKLDEFAFSTSLC